MRGIKQIQAFWPLFELHFGIGAHINDQRGGVGVSGGPWAWETPALMADTAILRAICMLHNSRIVCKIVDKQGFPMVSVDQIRNYPLFEGLNEAELARLASAIVKRSFVRGAYVFYPGNPGANAYLVESGLVRMFFSTASGQEILLNLASPPEAFSLPTLQERQLRVIGASAVVPTVLLCIGREDFFQMFDASPQFARNVYRTLLIISRKLLLHSRMFSTLDLNGRLATMLLRLAKKNANQEHIFQVPISQEDFAGWVGASRGRLNQAMKRLQQLGLIEVRGQTVAILDYAGLERLAEEQTMEKL